MDTRPGDLVLIHHNNKPVSYARIEEVLADVKPGWWQARILVLQVPPQEVTWILRDEYIDGNEFTMGGEPMRLEPVPPPESAEPPAPEPGKPKPQGNGPGPNVVDFSSRRKSK